jgi:hypothetical protein
MSRSTHPHDDLTDDAPLSAEASLALLREHQARAARSFDVDARLLHLVWGLAWLVGYTAFALSSDDTTSSPGLVPGAVLFLGVLGALVVTAVHTARATRGLVGPSAVSGALYGWAWPIAFVALTLLVSSLAVALDDVAVHAVLWPAGTGLVVGLLHLTGGAVWRDRLQYGLGAWVALTSCAAPVLGPAGQHWVMALAGGGGFLVAAALEARRRSGRTAASPVSPMSPVSPA